MDLKDQVCSLELSKRLKELGVKKKSLFNWLVLEKSHPLYKVHVSTQSIERLKELENGILIYGRDPYEKICGEFISYSAFTVAELGEILPKSIFLIEHKEDKKIFNNFRLVIGRSLIIDEKHPMEFWSINYICDPTNEFRNWLFDKLLTKPIHDNNEANARAKMLIYLIENNLYKIT